jgi:hypothetical protein
MKLLKVLTAVAVLATSSTAALSKNPPLNADVWKASQGDKLYEAYRKYGYVKYCNESRQGYLAVWVNDVQLDRARAHTKAVEDETVELLKSPKAEIDKVYSDAIRSMDGAWVTADSCRVVYQQLMAIPSKDDAGQINLKKDF